MYKCFDEEEYRYSMPQRGNAVFFMLLEAFPDCA